MTRKGRVRTTASTPGSCCKWRRRAGWLGGAVRPRRQSCACPAGQHGRSQRDRRSEEPHGLRERRPRPSGSAAWRRPWHWPASLAQHLASLRSAQQIWWSCDRSLLERGLPADAMCACRELGRSPGDLFFVLFCCVLYAAVVLTCFVFVCICASHHRIAHASLLPRRSCAGADFTWARHSTRRGRCERGALDLRILPARGPE